MIYRITLNQFGHNDGYPCYVVQYLFVPEMQAYELNEISQCIREGESEREKMGGGGRET